MFSKTSFLLPIAVLGFSCAVAQSLEENRPTTLDGIEYGYTIRNEQTKTAKGEEYARFEITLYATNKSGCTKLYADRVALLSEETANLIATYYCSNANGKRLTAKSGMVKARDFYVNAKLTEEVKDSKVGKEVIRSVKAGYIFRNGETLKNNIIVLVPLRDRPQIKLTTNYLPELR